MKILCVPKDAVFERGERGEKIYSERKDKKQKKKKSLHISHAQIYPLPGILQKKMAFALQINAAAATKKKTAAPKKTTVKKVRSCLFRAGLFPTGFRFFFFVSLAQNGFVFFKGRRKNATKKRTKKAQHSHLRVSAHSPPKTALSTPSNARIERRNVPGVHRCAL